LVADARIFLLMRRRGRWLARIGGHACVTSAFLTVFSYVLVHGFAMDGAAPLRSAVSLVSILIATILVLRNVSANLRVKEVERERANLAGFFSPKIVDQLVSIHTPFSFARRQPGTVLLPKGTHAELFLAFWASMGFKPGDFMTTGMNEKRTAWLCRVLNKNDAPHAHAP
jgi:hypothetical protein